MIYVSILLAIAGVVSGIVVIEKKRAQGPLTYPLWKGNLLIPWLAFAVLFALIIGSINLPDFVKLVMRGVSASAVVTEVKNEEHCTVTYRYKAGGTDYTHSDSKCGLKAGETHTIYYDPVAPGISTLYLPEVALSNELIAMALICLCLPTFLVIWLMTTHVIGRRAKP